MSSTKFYRDINGDTAIIRAIKAKDPGLINWLIAQNESVNPTNTRKSPLQCAVDLLNNDMPHQNKSISNIINILVNAGAKKNINELLQDNLDTAEKKDPIQALFEKYINYININNILVENFAINIIRY